MVKINIAILIRSPREIPEVLEAFKRINFMDKFWIKNYTGLESMIQANKIIKDHPEYTHFVMCSDDGIPTVKGLNQLIANINYYDCDVVSGCCNYCNMWMNKKGVCNFCEYDLPHKYINVALSPMNLPLDGTGTYFTRALTINDYNIVTENWREINQGTYRVWYQGFAYTFIKREIALKVPFRSEKIIIRGGETIVWGIHDVAFARDCAEKGIVQSVDTRAYFKHLGQHHAELQVGKKKAEIIIERKV